ncbi:Hypothetical protein A7982_05787 [Minicystis rosea]|nr:Hypothetical protein A7982_05787 [Minicystis rosea]
MSDTDDALAILELLRPEAGEAAHDWKALMDGIRRASEERHHRVLVALVRLCHAPPARLAMLDEKLRRISSLALETLALVDGDEAALAFATLALEVPAIFTAPCRAHPDALARAYGARLAQTHHEDTLGAVLRAHGEDAALLDLLACWLHEKVLRGGRVSALPEVQRFVATLVRAGHPLAALPLDLLAIERGVSEMATRYYLFGASGWGARINLPTGSEPEWPAGLDLPASSNVTTPRDMNLIRAIWESAKAVSNGRSEGRVLLLDPPAPTVTSALLRSLPVRCLAGATADAVQTKSTSPELAFEALLAFAANGGDYNIGWSGPWGRLAAWRSLRGLTLSGDDASLADVEARAQACSWFHFRADTQWFYRIVTDFGIAALQPDGSAIAVFAGTDTD